eukprot:TRINITY_DN47516_c0_g1_i1.p1 TRINITY_DN47516_c0_g1~~TRINITY_DN47516_c0_g1_i1.p1  ORF type:complete len:630 (+),score=108.37 TRINITY_DN47516_c0_g1_i1:31-1890(+)
MACSLLAPGAGAWPEHCTRAPLRGSSCGHGQPRPMRPPSRTLAAAGALGLACLEVLTARRRLSSCGGGGRQAFRSCRGRAVAAIATRASQLGADPTLEQKRTEKAQQRRRLLKNLMRSRQKLAKQVENAVHDEEAPPFQPSREPTREPLHWEPGMELPSWSELGVVDELAEALSDPRGLQIARPNALQASALRPILEGHDTILSSYTGSGKTLAAFVPMVQRLLVGEEIVRDPLKPCQPSLLAVLPTKGLVYQCRRVVEDLISRQRKLKMIAWKQMNQMDTKHDRYAVLLEEVRPDIYVATPRQISRNVRFNVVDLSRVQSVMFDEVDMLLEDRQALSTVLERLPVKDMQRVLVSASALAHPKIGMLLERIQPDFRIVDSSFRCVVNSKEAKPKAPEETFDAPPTVQHAVLEVRHWDGNWTSRRNDPAMAWDKKLDFVALLAATRGKGEVVMVFVNSASKHASIVKKVTEGLRERSMRSLRLHPKKPLKKKNSEAVQRVIVTTDEDGSRGLDFKRVSLVINFDLPHSYKNYLHRSGRTGRAGKKGMVVSLVTNPKEQRFQRKIINRIGVTESFKAQIWEREEDGQLCLDLDPVAESDAKLNTGPVVESETDAEPVSSDQ